MPAWSLLSKDNKEVNISYIELVHISDSSGSARQEVLFQISIISLGFE